MTTINAAASFQVPNGPTMTIASAVSVEAYDKVNVTVNPGEKDKAIAIQPGTATQLRLLVITSSLYGGELSFLTSDGTTTSQTAVKLDGPQIFIGAGSIGLFGMSPRILKFTNNHTDQSKKAYIEVLVGRVASA